MLPVAAGSMLNNRTTSTMGNYSMESRAPSNLAAALAGYRESEARRAAESRAESRAYWEDWKRETDGSCSYTPVSTRTSGNADLEALSNKNHNNEFDFFAEPCW